MLTPENMGEVHEIWASLIQTVQDISYYHSWEWASGVAEFLYTDTRGIVYFVVWQGETPVALFPLELKGHRFMGVAPCTDVSSLSHDHITFNDCLCSSGHDPVQLLQALVAELETFTPSRWRLLGLHSILDGTPLRAAVASINGFQTLCHTGPSSYYFDCTDTSIDALLPSRLRRNLRRRERKAKKLGEITFAYVDMRENSASEEALDSFFQLECSGWKGRSGKNTAISLSSSLTGLYRNLANATHNRYHCQINLMKIAGKPVAGQFCFLADESIHLIKIGFDEAYKHCAPGSLLLLELLRKSILCKNTRRIHLVTAPSWADRWHPKKLESRNVQIYNNSLPGSAQLLKARMRQTISTLHSIVKTSRLLKRVVK